MKRRIFIQNALITGVGLITAPSFAQGLLEKGIPVSRLTNSNAHHWFGYYDKLQTDPSGRYALCMEVDFCFRSPTADDIIKIGMVDLKDNNKWIDLGISHAWGWQQGCMLQFIPGSKDEVIWNDRKNGKFISRIVNIHSKKERILPQPVYTLAPNGKFGVGTNFTRIQYMRPGYGYKGVEDSGLLDLSPDNEGIYTIDLNTGETKTILSYKQIAQVVRPLGDVSDWFHYFNHLLISPDSSRLFFLNRCKKLKIEKGPDILENPDKYYSKYKTRAFTINMDGSDIYPLNDSGSFSHFIWKGNDIITAWAKTEDSDKNAFYEFKDKTKKYKIIDPKKMPSNGHNTYVPGSNYEWILNDTYPQGESRKQELYLYHQPSKRRIDLGRFYEPISFKNQISSEWRCDLHPRCTPDGKYVIFDSTHEGNQRQMYMVKIEDIINSRY